LVIEIRDVRQNPNENFRRLFSDENFHLIVWYKPDETIDGFELSYDKTGREKAIRWLSDKGFSHYRVDSGEQSPLANRTPMLTATKDKPELERLLSRFEASDDRLPLPLRDLCKMIERAAGSLRR
jgi:hypothetical protein